MENLEALNVPEETIKMQKRLAATLGGRDLLSWLSSIPVIAAKAQMMLVTTHRSRSLEPLLRLAQSPSLLPRTQRELLRVSRSRLANALLGNHAITEETLEVIVGGKLRQQLIVTLMCNPGISRHWRDKVFTRLASENPLMAADVAYSVVVMASHLDPDELETLLFYVEESKQISALSNPAVSEERRQRARESANPRALNALAKNPTLSAGEQLEILTKHPEAANNIALRAASREVRAFILENHSRREISTLALGQIENFSDEEIRQAVKFDALSQDDNVNCSVAGAKRALPVDVLKRFMAGDAGVYSQALCVLRDDVPESFIAMMAESPTELSESYLLECPKLKLTSSSSLRLLRLAAGERSTRLTSFRRWGAESLRNREQAEKVLSEIKSAVKPDFYAAFAGDWEGTGDEFIEYAHALDA